MMKEVQRICFFCGNDLDKVSEIPFVHIIVLADNRTEWGEYCSKQCAESDQWGPKLQGSRISKRKNKVGRELKK